MTLPRVFALLLFAQLVNIGVRETLDPDMWWHLRTGELIVQHGIPRHDVFSFTVTDDRPWITHEWLSEVLMWSVFRAGGLPALSVVFAALSALSLWLVYRCSEGQPYLAGMIVLLAAGAAAPSVGVRPQVFSLVMVAAFTAVIEGVRNRRLDRRALVVLPILGVLWVNLHAGYLLGVALLATYVVGDSLERVSNPQGDRVPGWADIRLMGVVAIGCFAAALVNPNGWSIWSYPFGTLGSAFMQQAIAEWRSPDFHTYLYWPFGALLSLGVLGWVLAPVRPVWADLLLFLGTAGAGLVSVRHIPLFALVATPIVARSFASIVRGTAAEKVLAGRREPRPQSRLRTRLNTAILVLGLLLTLIAGARRLSKNDAAIAKAFPVAAVDFLEREGLARERGFNSYVWGGYLIWRRIPVFVDGRADVYGDEFLSNYVKTLHVTPEWRKALDQYDVRYVLVEPSSSLATLLAASGQWRAVYADDVAQVFTRAGGESKYRLRGVRRAGK
jgi:hypothetical protein